MEKERNILKIQIYYYLKGNLKIGEGMEKVKNIIIMVNYYLKENMKIEKE